MFDRKVPRVPILEMLELIKFLIGQLFDFKIEVTSVKPKVVPDDI